MSIRNSTERALFNVNIVLANGLLIVKQYFSSDELSFCNKLKGNFWGFDLQTAQNVLLSHIFDKFSFLLFIFCSNIALICKMGWIPAAKTSTHWKENHAYLVLLSALPYEPAFRSAA